MAHNTLDAASFTLRLVDWYENQGAEIKSNLPDPDSDSWFAEASEAFLLATSDDSAASAPATRTRTAKSYTILLLRSDGCYEVLGTGLGSVGREHNDPRKVSEARRLEQKGEVKAVRLAREGVSAHVLRIEADMLPESFRAQKG